MKRRAQAEQVAAALPAAGLHPAVRRYLAGRRTRGPWAVALSGGADSVALLLLLRAHWPEQALVALHFNHRLRGRAGAADARFCQGLCRALDVPCVVGQWREARPAAGEAAARTARLAFFTEAMGANGSRLLWLAHQQDDIAESMLMRLARGSGAAGLATPRPVQRFADGRVFLRPLLTLKKSDLCAALTGAGVAWREDGTNPTPAYFRNRVRQSVVPVWQQAAGRDAPAGAALSRELLEEDDVALETWLDQLAPLKRGVLDLSRLQGVPRAVTRRALHRWLLAVRPDTDLSRQGFAVLLTAVERGDATRFSLGRSGFAVIRRDRLTYRRGQGIPKSG